MFEEFLEGILSPLGIVAVFVVGTKTGRQLIGRGAKAAIKATYLLAGRAGEMATEFGENAADLLAEAREETEETPQPRRKARIRRVS